ncbi:MAG TPA: zf-HC2 domain-containing protein [Pyrinomonadaceae bacterium]|nr:zf-HC2 domain-containing protein [Pyrinomonadaceae bacterium]
MKESAGAKECARAEDLVAYLYHEATATERNDFESHMRQCASCSEELAAFGGVREAITEWRNLSLGSFASPSLEANGARVSPTTNPNPGRSALAALRQFFALAPLWMRAATAAAVVAFCALMAIAVVHFLQRPQTEVVEKQVKSGYSEQEVEERIAQALKREKESQVEVEAAVSPERVADSEQPNARPQVNLDRPGTTRVATKGKQQPARRNRVRPSTELVSTDYLPFTASVDEEKLPSLTDLVNDAN